MKKLADKIVTEVFVFLQLQQSATSHERHQSLKNKNFCCCCCCCCCCYCATDQHWVDVVVVNMHVVYTSLRRLGCNENVAMHTVWGNFATKTWGL